MLSAPSQLTPLLFAYAGSVAIATLLAGSSYQKTWRRYRKDGATPSGFGAFLAPIMLGAAILAQAPGELIASLAIVLLGTAVYWIDDLVHLSARMRVMLSFLAGAGIGYAYLANQHLGLAVLIGMMMAAGLICVILTNMVNFCDGADLNLASFVALTALAILAFTPPYEPWIAVAIAALAFILPFGMMNSRPRTIYLGDSGSFAFAGLLTAMAMAFVHDFRNIAPEAAIPAALPTLDVAYVFVIRVIEKHDMLTRNYLHLYQRLNRRHAGFGYLFPQFVNALLCLGLAFALQQLGLGRIISVIAAMLLVTPTLYFLCRRIFLAGPPEGPLYETSR